MNKQIFHSERLFAIECDVDEIVLYSSNHEQNTFEDYAFLEEFRISCEISAIGLF